MARPTHIYASAFSRRERSVRRIRRRLSRRFSKVLPVALGVLTGAAVVGLAEFAPRVAGLL